MEINAYSQNNNVSSLSSTKSAASKESGSTLKMDDFLNLLVSQMTNQDSMNPMENTEFVSQLAQFSSLQAMTELTEISKQGQATSLIGKNVVMASYDNKGELVVDEGVVERVTIYSGKTNIYVNGKAFELSNVMEIKADTKAVVEEPIITDAVTEKTTITDPVTEETTITDAV